MSRPGTDPNKAANICLALGCTRVALFKYPGGTKGYCRLHKDFAVQKLSSTAHKRETFARWIDRQE